MGLVQKIFYYHMPSAWMFLVGGDRLRRRERPVPRHRRQPARPHGAGGSGADGAVRPAHAGDGSAVGARARGARVWVWDARTTSSLVGWMIACAYLILRKYGGPGSERLAAGLALFGMANVPFIYISVNYWRTIHPPTIVVPTLPFSMGFPLWFCVTTFLLLFMLLMTLRMRLEEQPARARRAASLAGRPSTHENACSRWCAVVLAVDRAGASRWLRPAAAAAGRVRAGVQLPPQEQLPAAPLLVGAYVFVLVALFVYVLSVAARLASVQQEIDRLEGEIKARPRS